MSLKKIGRKISQYNLFILIILFLLGFSVFYFLYYRQRNVQDIFVSLTLTRQSNTLSPGGIPYWVSSAIEIGNQEINPLGGVSATVMDKDVYGGAGATKYVVLQLKIRAIHDRTGVYLFKNKPLMVGGYLDLKLKKTQVQGVITYLDVKPVEYKREKLIVTLQGKAVDPWIAEGIKIGSTIIDDKEQVVAKVIDKKVSSAESLKVLTSDIINNRSKLSFDASKRDLELKVELMARKINDEYYFAETQKIKINESMYLAFPEMSVNLPIISVQVSPP